MIFDSMKPIWLQVATQLKRQIVNPYQMVAANASSPRDPSFPEEGTLPYSMASIPTPPPGSTRRWNGKASA